jgi:hypothetical protein
MVLSATFNNISVILWRSLLVEETGVPGENHRPVANHWQTLSHNVVSITPRHECGSNSQLVVIGTYCTQLPCDHDPWRRPLLFLLFLLCKVISAVLCLGMLKHRAPLATGAHLPANFFFTVDFYLCYAILNLKAFCFGAIPDIMIELIVYESIHLLQGPSKGPQSLTSTLNLNTSLRNVKYIAKFKTELRKQKDISS